MSVWPHERSVQEMNAFYGNPVGHEGVDRGWYAANIVELVPPYQMRFSWGPPVARLWIHRKCHDAFATALENIKKHYGSQAEIERHRLHLTGGAFCFRLMRGSATHISVHGWGAAIDMDPEHNPFPKKWTPGIGMMPADAAKCFQDAGLVWRGANGDIDSMHFQAALR